MGAALTDEVATDLSQYMSALGQAARAAASELAHADPEHKNRALLAIAGALDQRREFILHENARDLDAATKAGLASALVERLELRGRIDAMIEGLQQVAGLADPVGEISELRYRPSGIQVGKMRVPLGVIGIIYESRPNVTIDAAALCLKSGNASILRGGTEALHSNQAIYSCIQQGLQQAGMIDAAVQVVNTTDRMVVGHMLQMQDSTSSSLARPSRKYSERGIRVSPFSLILVHRRRISFLWARSFRFRSGA